MRITLGDHIVEINERTTTNNQHRVLTSSQKGIVSQDEYFNKQIASKENTGYKIVKRGQFTYRAMSDTGRFYINRLMEYDVGIVSPAYPVFEVIEDNIIYTPYIVLFFESDYFQSLIVNQSTGSTRVSLKLDKIKKISIDIPSYQEQKEIVEKIESAKRAIAARDEQLSCFNELVKSRFIELFGDPIDNTMGLKTMPLGEACFLKAGITTAADAIHEQSAVYPVPCYGGNGIRGYVKEATQHGCYPIIGRQGALCGNVQMATGEFHATEHAVLVTPLIETNVVWLFHLLRMMDLYRFHTGAAQPGLAVKTLNTVDIPIAEIAVQNNFASFVEQTDKSKFFACQTLSFLLKLANNLQSWREKQYDY